MPESCLFACTPSLENPSRRRIVRIGFFRRTSDAAWIQRYRCRGCNRSFSDGTRSIMYRQRKRHVNSSIASLYASHVNQRRIALILRLDRKTVVRKILFESRLSVADQVRWRAELIAANGLVRSVDFDDLETFEHTKCKPLSVVVAVETGSRRILAARVSRMPANGPLAAISRRKYGPRRDERSRGWTLLMKDLKGIVAPDAEFRTDQNPHYAKYVKLHFPHAKHLTFAGARERASGFGELKELREDPLFSINHTFASMRANMNRLARRTWCTTKKPSGLRTHLAIYIAFHNRVLLDPKAKRENFTGSDVSNGPRTVSPHDPLGDRRAKMA